jgi:AcrR family transcriptional regulator
MATDSTNAKLAAQDWIDAALTAIADRGLAAVAVEPLARVLGATKGSFYWHFQNREALVAAALAAWEAGETLEVESMLAPLPDSAARLRVLLRAALDDRLGARVEAGLLADSNVPSVHAALERATRARTAYLRRLFEEFGSDTPRERATTTFAIYLGLLHLRRAHSTRAPQGEDLDRYVQHVATWLTQSIEPASEPSDQEQAGKVSLYPTPTSSAAPAV